MKRLGLWHKEWLEAIRTYKLLIIPVVFFILGVMQPLAIHFMPEILSRASLPEGTVLQIPVPPTPEIIAMVMDQLSQLGIFVIVLSAMGMVAREIEHGQAGLLFTLGVSRRRYLLAKWSVLALIVVAATVIGFAAAAYYAEVLFGGVDWRHVIAAALTYALYPLFVLSITLMCSVAFSNQLASAGSVLGLVLLFGLAAMLSPDVARWLPSQASGAARLLLVGDNAAMPHGILVPAAWSASALLVAGLALSRREL